jgi:hypothetical protein
LSRAFDRQVVGAPEGAVEVGAGGDHHVVAVLRRGRGVGGGGEGLAGADFEGCC